MAKRERLSSVDTAWLRMDRPNNLMLIVGVLMFDRRLDRARLARTLRARLLAYRRFRQRVVSDATGAYWEDDEEFDLDYHLRHSALRKGEGKLGLERLVAELAAAPLDPLRPLWQMQMVDNYQGGSALIVRIHHCIADGIALIGVMLSLTDATPDAPEEGGAAPGGDDVDPGGERGVLEQLLASGMKWSGIVWDKYKELLQHPHQALDYLKLSGAMAGEIGALAAMSDDSRTRFKGRPGPVKCVAWSEPLRLHEVKAVGKALGCSVNDVLLASVAGALRAYLLEHGDPVEGCELRALVPVNLRPSGDEHKLGNRFGLVALLLPVGIENPFRRLFMVQARMEALKGSYQAPLTLAVLGVVGLCPKPIQTLILDLLAKKATAVMTNVPGPQTQRYLCGAKLLQQMFWVPQSGDIGMGVSILSYNGTVQFGLITDQGLVPDPQAIVDRFRSEFDKLLLTLLMQPWDAPREPEEVEAMLAGSRGLDAQTKRRPPRKPVRPRRGGNGSGQTATVPRTATTPASGEPPAGPAAEAAVKTRARIPKRFRV